MRILITGVAGYIGSYTATKFLKQGHQVRGMDVCIFGEDSVKRLQSYDNFTLIKGDIRETKVLEQALDEVDAVIHLAAIVGAPESDRIPDLTWKINFDSTKELVQLVKKHKTPRFIFVSTCSNYGASGKDNLADETTKLTPISAYAESKVAAEEHILADTSPDFNPTICRVATVFGISPRMRFDLLVNEFTRDAFYKRKLTVMGTQGRAFVHLFDVVKAFDLIINTPVQKVTRQIFNIGSTKMSNHTKRELGQIVADTVGDVQFEYIEKDLDARDYKVSFDKIHNQLGFGTTYDIVAGVKEIVAYLKAHPDIDAYSDKYRNLHAYLDFK